MHQRGQHQQCRLHLREPHRFGVADLSDQQGQPADHPLGEGLVEPRVVELRGGSLPAFEQFTGDLGDCGPESFTGNGAIPHLRVLRQHGPRVGFPRTSGGRHRVDHGVAPVQPVGLDPAPEVIWIAFGRQQLRTLAGLPAGAENRKELLLPWRSLGLSRQDVRDRLGAQALCAGLAGALEHRRTGLIPELAQLGEEQLQLGIDGWGHQRSSSLTGTGTGCHRTPPDGADQDTGQRFSGLSGIFPARRPGWEAFSARSQLRTRRNL